MRMSLPGMIDHPCPNLYQLPEDRVYGGLDTCATVRNKLRKSGVCSCSEKVKLTCQNLEALISGGAQRK